jgi:hypothetical protein
MVAVVRKRRLAVSLDLRLERLRSQLATCLRLAGVGSDVLPAPVLREV